MEKVNEMSIKLYCAVHGFLKDEKGDTNFISIIVILGIVAILAGVFMGFKDTIVQWAEDNILSFFG